MLWGRLRENIDFDILTLIFFVKILKDDELVMSEM